MAETLFRRTHAIVSGHPFGYCPGAVDITLKDAGHAVFLLKHDVISTGLSQRAQHVPTIRSDERIVR